MNENTKWTFKYLGVEGTKPSLLQSLDAYGLMQKQYLVKDVEEGKSTYENQFSKHLSLDSSYHYKL